MNRRLSPFVVALHLASLCFALAPPIVFGAVVAPAVFRVLPTRDMAGALQSPMLSKMCGLAEGSFLVLFVTSWLLTAPRSGTRAFLTRLPVLGFFAALVIRRSSSRRSTGFAPTRRVSSTTCRPPIPRGFFSLAITGSPPASSRSRSPRRSSSFS